MLKTASTCLEIGDSFKKAFDAIPEDQIATRTLFTPEGQETDYYQVSVAGSGWMAPKKKKNNDILCIKDKLMNAEIFYNVFSKPTYAGGDGFKDWLVGDLVDCELLGENYTLQGILIASVFDPRPKFYISFKRLVCENQFSTLGRNSSSMYIDMDKFLIQAPAQERVELLKGLIHQECTARIQESQQVYDRLAYTKLSKDQIISMFRHLTLDTVSKNNVEAYQKQQERYNVYVEAYNVADNANFMGTLMGFVNACTYVNTREQDNIMKLLTPVLPADVVNNPCNFEYLCRSALVQATGN